MRVNETGKEVVDDDVPPESVDEQSHFSNAVLVHTAHGSEQARNQIRTFGHHRQCRKEPAISDLTLNQSVCTKSSRSDQSVTRVCSESLPSNGVGIERPLEKLAFVPTALLGASIVWSVHVGSLSRAVGNDRRLGGRASAFDNLALRNGLVIVEDRTNAVHSINRCGNRFEISVVVEKGRQTTADPIELSLDVGLARCGSLVAISVDFRLSLVR
mmetsp:Transcript_509/g.1520  ORF Transcript_509/g.1520 Transcript_509/m.1520 type:complete len:214 (-) Transcript_509:362-1003(-)